jgi:heterodisulfide reductase subunit B2
MNKPAIKNTLKPLRDVSYFPGCSLSTTAHESNESLVISFQRLGINLVELEDWNCCGSSSAHSIQHDLAADLPARNLSLAPPDRPLLVACPSCLLRLRETHESLKKDVTAQDEYEIKWQKPFNPDLKIYHFFELLEGMNLNHAHPEPIPGLRDLKFAAYYGCMLARPPALNREKNYHGLMENMLSKVGALSVNWNQKSRCCGTFLTVARPDVVTPIVNDIVQDAMDAGAECIITACAMCHMNLEVRCTVKKPIPIFHFSEILSLAMGTQIRNRWFARHLINPVPLLKSRKLI